MGEANEIQCFICGLFVYRLPSPWWREGGVAVCPTCCSEGAVGGIVAHAMLRNADGYCNTPTPEWETARKGVWERKP